MNPPIIIQDQPTPFLFQLSGSFLLIAIGVLTLVLAYRSWLGKL